MDTRTGEIITHEELMKKSKQEQRFFVPLTALQTPEQMKRVPPRVGPNEPCGCGSGKKFKRCCRGRIK
jgi:uncharacterized protein YecA (UPF0149 family)